MSFSTDRKPENALHIQRAFFVFCLSFMLLVSNMAGCAAPGEAAKEMIIGNNRTTYEIFVSSYADSNGDGCGDLKGIKENLSVIKDMGFNAIWLTPVCSSPSYHKYDITDFKTIDPAFGTLDDYRALCDEAHNLGIQVLFDLVCNHTSRQHPWFQELTDYLVQCGDEPPKEEECRYLSYYNISETPKDGYRKLNGTRFYYESRFSENMPDLNLNNQEVRDYFNETCKFWIDNGCDGFRLDAVYYYYTGNDEANIEFLTWLNDAIKITRHDAYVVGECWSNRNIYREYYKSGVDSFFDFSAAGPEGIITQMVHGTLPAKDFAKALSNAEEQFKGSETSVNAPFFTNHDLARAAGYFTGEHAIQQTKLASICNLLYTGDAFVYYGEELGMKGSGKDESKRLAYLWGTDKEARYQCKDPAGSEKFEQPNGSYSSQKNDKKSILNLITKMIHLRTTTPAVSAGRTAGIDIGPDELCVFTKEYKDSKVLVAVNFSNVTQTVNLNSDATAAGFKYMKCDLSTDERACKLKNGNLSVPAYSACILTPVK